MATIFQNEQTKEFFFKDCVIDKIMFHLKEQMNAYGQKFFGFDIVTGVRNYNSYNVGMHEYPLLAVYRTRDDFVDETDKSYGGITVSYRMAYPNQENLHAINNKIGKIIHYFVNSLHTKIGVETMQSNRPCTYRTISSGGGQTAINTVDYSFTIVEGLLENLLQ